MPEQDEYEEIRDDPEPFSEGAERVDVYAGSVPGFFDVMAIPSINPSIGGTLTVIGLVGHGLRLDWRDAYGSVVWTRELVGVGMKTLETR